MTIPEITDGDGVKYGNFTFFKKGGMGEIYKGQEINTGKEVVLKLVVIDIPDEETLLQTELEVSKKFSHENIVKTLHTGKIEIEGNNYLFVIQQFYPSGNLRYLIKENIPIEKCFIMMLDILGGINEIHKVIVHRDMKPENILVDSCGRLLITDFGLAKYIDEKTRTRSFKGYGTIPYMAPECWTGDTNTISMDIYSLGIIFYEIITGHLPYTAKTEMEWREFHLFTPLPSISSYRSGMTIKFDQIIQKMSNKRPSHRYKTVGEIIVAVNEAKTINATEMNEAERLARLGNFELQNQKAQELKAIQETQKTDEWIKFINYEITELFNNVIEKATAVNKRLEDGKIKFSEQLSDKGTTSRKLTLIFGSKSIIFKFTNHDAVERHNTDYKERYLGFQRKNYGMVIESPENCFLKTNKIVLVGLAETGFNIGDKQYGFNLLLKKLDDSNYGEWQIVQFSENITPPKTKFGINLPDFFDSFEKIRYSSFHTMTFRNLKDSDIFSLLEKIFFN